MKREQRGYFGQFEFFIVLLIASLVVTIAILMWKGSEVNAELWNRCFPESKITQLEAFWSGVTIDQCPVNK